MLHNLYFTKKGFTLVELLVVLAVIAILSGILVANFPEIRQQLALKRAAYKLAQDIRWVQEMAMSSAEFKESEDCLDPSAFTAYGYGIHIDLSPVQGSNKSYILYADTNGDEDYTSVADCIIKTVSLEEKGIVIKEIQNVVGEKVTINFKPPNPKVNIELLQAGTDNVKIVLTVLALEQDLLKTKSVLVNKAGLIEVK